MKIGINKKYKYLTFEEHCPNGMEFCEWVMQEEYETHSIIEIGDDLIKENLMFDQFDYYENMDKFVFNRNKYDEYLVGLDKPKPPSDKERIAMLEDTILFLLEGGMM